MSTDTRYMVVRLTGFSWLSAHWVFARGGGNKMSVKHPDGTIHAPFTEAEVHALNAWQKGPNTHPFTCPHRHKEKQGRYVHRWRADMTERGALRATVQGWICLDCDYTQDWAHDFMVHRNALGQVMTALFVVSP